MEIATSLIRQASSRFHRILMITALILSGEIIFTLPFVVARIFRPTLLDVFGLTNLQLGTAFSVYGIVAMGSYFLGGPLADRYSARRLITAALVATSLGGLIFATIPAIPTLTLLYGFWGLTTILLFWAALIRATREWGGDDSQGRAYGFLDGGRGLVAALLASTMVAIFAALLPVDAATATLAQRSAALAWIIRLFTGLTLATALLIWLALPDRIPAAGRASSTTTALGGVRRVLAMPAVWLQAVIVVCAYAGYKSTDDFSLLARDTFGFDDVAAAQVGTISFWVRPFAAVGAGLLADRFGASRTLVASFGLLTLGSFAIAGGILQPGIPWLLMVTLVATSAAIYAARGVYFALFQEGRVPLSATGAAVGLVSVLGYTPDIFMGPLMGYLLDRSPGALGHRHVFAAVGGFAGIGLLASLVFRRVAYRRTIRATMSTDKPKIDRSN